MMVSAAPLGAQQASRPANVLAQVDEAVQSLVERVSGSVLQVLVTSYGPLQSDASTAELILGKQRVSRSGIVSG
jgi:hypothetical protein